MIDRLQELLPYLQYLPPGAQEEIANHIEALAHKAFSQGRMKELLYMTSFEELWEDPAGSLSDLPDDMLKNLIGLDILRYH